MGLKRSPEDIADASDDPTAPILLARGIHKSYVGPGGRLEVLRGVDLEVARGTLLAIVGASGSGKSTLLNILGTLDRADQGTLEVGGRRLEGMSERDRCTWRARRLGFVFQFHHLLSEFTAEENVMMPLLVAGASFEAARVRAREALGWVGLEERREHLPSELSGGEAQRVAVARAISPAPDLILADEPSGNLDAAAAGRLHSLLSSLTRERHQTVVLVTHNDRLAAQADRVLKLDAGRLDA
jgi:lipoprotein-releasing system ATP-binding protein